MGSEIASSQFIQTLCELLESVPVVSTAVLELIHHLVSTKQASVISEVRKYISLPFLTNLFNSKNGTVVSCFCN